MFVRTKWISWTVFSYNMLSGFFDFCSYILSATFCLLPLVRQILQSLYFPWLPLCMWFKQLLMVFWKCALPFYILWFICVPLWSLTFIFNWDQVFVWLRSLNVIVFFHHCSFSNMFYLFLGLSALCWLSSCSNSAVVSMEVSFLFLCF